MLSTALIVVLAYLSAHSLCLEFIRVKRGKNFGWAVQKPLKDNLYIDALSTFGFGMHVATITNGYMSGDDSDARTFTSLVMGILFGIATR